MNKKYILFLIFFIFPFFLCAEKEQESEIPPFFNNRINFNLLRFGYERTKDNSFYFGSEISTFYTIEKSLISQGEIRFGYNYKPHTRNKITPFLSIGSLENRGRKTHSIIETFFKPLEISYGGIGVRYEHIFGKIFSLGLNTQWMHGVNCWHMYTQGFNISTPFTWRFTKSRNWDIRLEPFYTRFSHNFSMGGVVTSFGYSF